MIIVWKIRCVVFFGFFKVFGCIRGKFLIYDLRCSRLIVKWQLRNVIRVNYRNLIGLIDNIVFKNNKIGRF